MQKSSGRGRPETAGQAAQGQIVRPPISQVSSLSADPNLTKVPLTETPANRRNAACSSFAELRTKLEVLTVG